MKRLFLSLILTAVDWFPVEPPEPNLFPVVAPDDTDKEARRVLYVKALDQAEKNGAVTYQSDGKPGSYLPPGRYRLFWAKGPDGWDVYVEENPKIIPRPDIEDCPT